MAIKVCTCRFTDCPQHLAVACSNRTGGPRVRYCEPCNGVRLDRIMSANAREWNLRSGARTLEEEGSE